MTTVAPPPAPSANPHHRGGRILFEIPFTAALSDPELAVLGHVLDISTHMQAKVRPTPTSPGVARLDDFSGLFLERGAEEGEWLFQARTWGRPAADTVHAWHVLAALAVRRLDPEVPLPGRLADPRARTVADRAVGTAANRRLAHARRRLAGLR